MSDDFYGHKIVEYINTYHSMDKEKIRKLLYPMFPGILTDSQKENKINNLLPKLKKSPYNLIKVWWTQKAIWKIKEN